MKCLAIKIFARNNSQLKKYNCNFTHSYSRKILVAISSYIIFQWFFCNRNSRKLQKRSGWEMEPVLVMHGNES